MSKRHGVSRMWLGKWCRRLGEEGAAPPLLPVRVSMSKASAPRRIEARVGDVVVAYVSALLRSVGV